MVEHEKLCLANDFEKKLQHHVASSQELSHSNVVAIYDAGVTTDSGAHYIVMDYVPGELLSAILTRGELTLERSKDIFGQIVEGVQYLHHQCLYHGSLAPNNILVSKTERGADLAYILASDFCTACLYRTTKMAPALQF